MDLNITGMPAVESNSAFGEAIRNGEYIPLVAGYFHKVKEMLPEIENERECLVVIWVDDLPVKILFVENGDLLSNAVLERSHNMGAFDIIKLAILQEIPVYHAE
ncbi:LysR family transcriptional regulator [Oceanobacillus picturae]|uniref:LysR family transcriptional regulator n=1 Tax=Oceanobacillus picturae TaxID=171693 RepID=A0A0U9H7Q5_9BACI|nr:hypothetical protein [Oceanobacillus picturae]GAQ18693.1 LysR family transcriptional regulator [Oceanobacillus picturae]